MFSESLRSRRLVCFAMLLIGMVRQSHANTGDPMRWFGFGSIGAVKSDSDIPYRRGFITRDFTFDVDTKLGLNASAEIGDSWSASGQLLARGSSNFFRAEADWVFVAYKPINELAITVGKQKLPIWFFSDRYDLGLVQPWVRPPDEFYFLNPITTFVGPNLRYWQNLGGWELGGELYIGAATVDRDFEDSQERDMARNLKGGFLSVGRENLLSVRVAYAQADVEVRVLSPFDTTTVTPSGPVTTRDALVFDIPQSPFEYISVGLKSERENLLLYAEYSRTRGDDPRLGTIKSGYVTIGYRIGGFLMPHYTYAALNSDQPPPQNPGNQHSNILGLKAWFNPRLAIKAEWQRTNVVSGKGLFSQDPGREAVNFISASLDFIF